MTLVEHRQDSIRDISYEALTLGRKLAVQNNCKLTAVLLGEEVGSKADTLKPWADRVLVADHETFKNFNAETYQIALAALLEQEKPRLMIIGHSMCGADLAPALATELAIPFSTDCLNAEIAGENLKIVRQIYDGKLNARLTIRNSSMHLITLRSGSCPAESSDLNGIVEKFEPKAIEPDYRRFIEYIEAVVGDVDITRSDVLVGIGRGIKEQANIAMIEDFAKTINGVVACTRPVVDAGWLPKDRQIGSSGKTVKPKLYIALGISGAFQHIAGMKGADTVIAVNKDPNAPIFNEADYGIVDDLFKIVPVLKNKIAELKK
jgi:electron transfer flavoprotein alpha subunit